MIFFSSISCISCLIQSISLLTSLVVTKFRFQAVLQIKFVAWARYCRNSLYLHVTNILISNFFFKCWIHPQWTHLDLSVWVIWLVLLCHSFCPNPGHLPPSHPPLPPPLEPHLSTPLTNHDKGLCVSLIVSDVSVSSNKPSLRTCNTVYPTPNLWFQHLFSRKNSIQPLPIHN